MSDKKDLLVRREDGVLVLTFNRPEQRNALTQEMQATMAEELAAAELDREVGCILLTGAGGAFCAGGDVKNMARLSAGAPVDQLRRMETQRQSQRRTSLRLFEMGKPTIAALPGAAAGAGLSIALSCDMRIAAETAIMSTAFVKIGLSGDYGGTYLLTQLVGPAKARELYLLGDRIDMKEALRLGLVNWVVPAAELEAKAMAAAKRLAAKPRAALLAARRLLKGDPGPIGETIAKEVAEYKVLMRSPEAKEAFTAFLEKRPPDFAKARRSGG